MCIYFGHQLKAEILDRLFVATCLQKVNKGIKYKIYKVNVTHLFKLLHPEACTITAFLQPHSVIMSFL